MSAWYHPVRLVSFCPQNLDETARKTTRYTSFSGSGTLGDEILYGIVREKFLELAVELCRQCLVVRNDQRRFIQLPDDIAIVKVLPEPVTPKRVSHWLSPLKPLTSRSMA